MGGADMAAFSSTNLPVFTGFSTFHAACEDMRHPIINVSNSRISAMISIR